MPTLRSRALLALLVVGAAVPLRAQEPLFPVRLDAAKNRILLEIAPSRLGTDFLYTNTLATGLGSSLLAMDRGETGSEAVVRFERRGARVHLVQDNWGVRALGADAAGQRAARESYPTAVMASFPIDAETNGTLVIDASSFFFSDVWGVADRFRGRNQGSYRIDRDRSFADTAFTKAFARNTEVRVVLTYVSDAPGQAARRVAPEAGALTMAQHHSMVALPELGSFRGRVFDPRSGMLGVSFIDHGQGFDGNYRGGYTNRWRLVPKDTAAYLRGELTEPVTPIIYYVDPGVPEPYHTAFIEGGNWWNKVFEGAGFKNAFSVRPMPAGIDPLDVRHNVLLWVHRNGPGPSVGPSFADPRTGEIMKTTIRMDSHRSLIDYNIYAGLLPAAGDRPLNMSAEDFAMSRRRQHAAHEIGHTLGLDHNYIASSQGRASVMDYPFPRIGLDGAGRPDLSNAYSAGPGAWDSLAVNYAYRWYPDARSEEAGIAKTLAGALARGLRFINDQHVAADGSIPAATRWDEGATPFEALQRTTRVRSVLIDKFDERAIKPGESMAALNMRFAHVYLHHRYSLEGVIKNVGGMDFSYAMRGDGQTPTRVLPLADQRRALRLALDALAPAALAVPDRIAALIPPAPPGNDGSDQWIGSAGGTAFDPLSLAGGLATEVLQGLLDRERTARLVIFAARDAQALSLDEVLRTIVDDAFGDPASTPRAQALRRVVQQVTVATMLDRASDPRTMAQVRSQVEFHLTRLDARLKALVVGAPEDQALRATIRRDIARYFAGEDDPTKRSRYAIVPLPWP